MSSLEKTRVFNNPKAIVEGWYWAMTSNDLKSGQVKPLNLMGKELVLYRTEKKEGSDQVVAMDAYCPHMGAHLAEGKVEGSGVRCFFHHWKFSQTGALEDIPCRKKLGVDVKTKTYPTEEKYGMIWIWTGDNPRHRVPYIPELKDAELDTSFGNQFVKECHPNVVMINAIDAHHFTSVHNLPVDVQFEAVKLNENCIQFNNTTKIPHSNPLLRFISRFYSDALTYSMCYWNASTGSVTVGPDFLHCHIIFALRPTKDGQTEGQTILVTRKRKGILGYLFNRIVLFATKCVGNYFAKGDTEVFKTINFSLKTPIKEDYSIIKFIQHTEKQKTTDWGFAEKVSAQEKRSTQQKNCAMQTHREVEYEMEDLC